MDRYRIELQHSGITPSLVNKLIEIVGRHGSYVDKYTVLSTTIRLYIVPTTTSHNRDKLYNKLKGVVNES